MTAASTATEPDSEALRGLQVLVVEDTPTNLLITRLLLEEMGCHVSTASDGIEALESLQSKSLTNRIDGSANGAMGWH